MESTILDKAQRQKWCGISQKIKLIGLSLMNV